MLLYENDKWKRNGSPILRSLKDKVIYAESENGNWGVIPKDALLSYGIYIDNHRNPCYMYSGIFVIELGNSGFVVPRIPSKESYFIAVNTNQERVNALIYKQNMSGTVYHVDDNGLFRYNTSPPSHITSDQWDVYEHEYVQSLS